MAFGRTTRALWCRRTRRWPTRCADESGASVGRGRHALAAVAASRNGQKRIFSDGRVPELLDGVDDAVRARLEAFVLLRAGDVAGAAKIVEQAEVQRPAIAGLIGSKPFTDFRDLDDITAGVFEVLTRTGKYYWIPMNRVELIEFTPPERPLDLLWRPARMVVRDAFDAQVHLPAVYGGGAARGEDDASRLGRRTDWIGRRWRGCRRGRPPSFCSRRRGVNRYDVDRIPRIYAGVSLFTFFHL